MIANRQSPASRTRQVERARGENSVALARAFVAGKIRNQRTLLRRLGADGAAVAVGQLAGLITRSESASTLGELLGVEGTAARVYFGALPGLLKSAGDELTFEGRNRRPPTDPVNAMLSFAYALLVRDDSGGIGRGAGPADRLDAPATLRPPVTRA